MVSLLGLFIVKTERDQKDAPITRSILREIQIAFRSIGASEREVADIPYMSVEELCDLRRKLKADPYLQAYIRFWGDALPDEDILYFLQRWNSLRRLESTHSDAMFTATPVFQATARTPRSRKA